MITEPPTDHGVGRTAGGHMVRDGTDHVGQGPWQVGQRERSGWVPQALGGRATTTYQARRVWTRHCPEDGYSEQTVRPPVWLETKEEEGGTEWLWRTLGCGEQLTGVSCSWKWSLEW